MNCSLREGWITMKYNKFQKHDKELSKRCRETPLLKAVNILTAFGISSQYHLYPILPVSLGLL